MTKTVNKTEAPENAVQKSHGHFYIAVKRMSYSKINIVCAIIVVFYILVAALAPLICKYNYNDMCAKALLAPCWEHPFGTDNFGRDYFSRVIYGARYSMAVGFGSQIISVVAGAAFGAAAGYYGGKIDEIFMRFCDIWQSIPGILLTMAMCVAFGTGWVNTLLALSISGIPGGARLMRASFLRIRKSEYIDAAKAIDCSDAKIITKHMIPNAFAPVLVSATMGVGGKLMSAASLSFLGMGIQAPTPEWGALLSAGRDYMRTAPWLCIIPGLTIMILVLSLNLLGDGLRDALDPKLKK
ncbi:MAG: ABC transporter permease [Oscillospiraceae bacterium]